MTTILIVCGAGASSTFLATRLRAIAAGRGDSVTVQASSDDDLDARLSAVDVLLVGSHLSGAFDSLRDRAAGFGVPAGLLSNATFGPGGAEAAYELFSSLTTTQKDVSHG